MPRYIKAENIRPYKGFFEKVDNVPKFYDWVETLPTADVVEKERYDILLEHANILAEELRKYQNADVPERNVGKWVPVTERLPKPNEKDEDGIQKYYLIQNEFGDMMVASYREKNLFGDTWWEQMYAYKPIADKVIAWMPLPEPYRKDGEQDEQS